jgi:HD-GYP domain-containing protein (c-di-GMP phosphodiesterase class II)
MDQLMESLSMALDVVEGELLGASTYHGKRIAVLVAAMCRHAKMDDRFLSAATFCALLHDNALTEYIDALKKGDPPSMRPHCQYGQRNAEMLPFESDIDGFILYHHEYADGSGAFGKKAGEYPFGAELIAIADMIDIDHHLATLSFDTLPDLRRQIVEDTGKRFTIRAAGAMLAILDEEILFLLRDDRIEETVQQSIPFTIVNLDNGAMMRLAEVTARIIDYKSTFTRKHTSQIANRAWLMSGYYGCNDTLRTKIYLAAALHDIGKLVTPVNILEKPGKLNEEEFTIIKKHVYHTWNLLRPIDGFEDICRWASEHHEKLDGSGYPFGKRREDLDFISRMLACIDIYQAVSEARPYHNPRDHQATMAILYGMAEKGFVDESIVKDMDLVMAEYSNQDIPSPALPPL